MDEAIKGIASFLGDNPMFTVILIAVAIGWMIAKK